MNATQNTTVAGPLAKGDAVLVLTRSTWGDDKIELGKVARMTPDGKLVLEGDAKKAKFKRSGLDYGMKNRGIEVVCYQTGNEYDKRTVYPNSEEVMAALRLMESERKAAQAEKRAAKDLNRQKRELREEAELSEVQSKLGGSYEKFIDLRKTSANGGRLVVLTVPTLVEADGISEVTVIIRMDTVKASDWLGEDDKKTPVIKAHMSYTARPDHSFPSCGGSNYASDETAIWDCIKHAMRSWF